MNWTLRVGCGICRDDTQTQEAIGIWGRIQDFRFTVRTKDRHERDYGWLYGSHWWNKDDWNTRGGLYRTAQLNTRWLTFQGHHDLKTYAEAVGLRESMDWIIDEFDASFNNLAVASMTDEQRGIINRYQDAKDAWGARIADARADFVRNILPGLWS